MSLLVLAALVVIAKRSATSAEALGLTRLTPRLLDVLWQIPLTFIALVAVQLVTAVLTDNANEGAGGAIESIGLDASGSLQIAIFVSIAILTPLWEEILFRGFIFTSLWHRWGTTTAVLVTAVVFAAVHGIPMLLPYLLTLGLAMSLLRIFHRNIWGSLLLHISINSIASLTLLVAMFQ